MKKKIKERRQHLYMSEISQKRHSQFWRYARQLTSKTGNNNTGKRSITSDGLKITNDAVKHFILFYPIAVIPSVEGW
jgi:hypothetical protein